MMVRFVMDLIDNHQNGVVLAPRGSAKTTWPNTILFSWLISNRPDLRVGLFSQKDRKAEAMSSAIKTTISENENHISVFGDLRNTAKWTDSEWFVKGSPWTGSKDRTMIAGGANSSSGVSKRFDIILLDDILDEGNTYTLDQREKIETWFWKSLKPTLVPNGSVIVLGTRWTEGDLYEKMIESNKWPSLVIPAITRDDSTGEETSVLARRLAPRPALQGEGRCRSRQLRLLVPQRHLAGSAKARSSAASGGTTHISSRYRTTGPTSSRSALTLHRRFGSAPTGRLAPLSPRIIAVSTGSSTPSGSRPTSATMSSSSG